MKPIPSIALTSILASLAFAIPAVAGDSAKTSAMLEPLRSVSGPEFDRQFLSMMREHHSSGVEIATLAKGRAQREEVKDFAEKVAKKQQKEIAQIDDLLKDTRNVAQSSSTTATSADRSITPGAPVAGSSTTPGTASTSSTSAAKQDIHGSAVADKAEHALQKLESASGAEFDRSFVEHMTKHHRSGIEMAQLALARASDDDVKEFAEEMIKDNQKELDELARL